jgi:hypothetical protein
MERTEYSETSAYKLQAQGKYPEESLKILRLLVVFLGASQKAVVTESQLVIPQLFPHPSKLVIPSLA